MPVIPTFLHRKPSKKSIKSYLEPVKGKNYEGGIKASLFDEALDMSLSVFEIRQDNVESALAM